MPTSSSGLLKCVCPAPDVIVVGERGVDNASSSYTTIDMLSRPAHNDVPIGTPSHYDSLSPETNLFGRESSRRHRYVTAGPGG